MRFAATDRIAFERPRAHDGQSFQVERRAREMAQQLMSSFLKSTRASSISLASRFTIWAIFPLSNIGATKSRHQNNGHDNGHNLHDFFHFLICFKDENRSPPPLRIRFYGKGPGQLRAQGSR